MFDRKRLVYALRHNPTGKVYVGSTVHIRTRIQDHINALRRGSHPVPQMQNDYNKFGDDYSYFILEETEERNGFKQEYFWMSVFHSRDPKFGYNYRDKKKPVDLHGYFEEHKIPPKSDTPDELLTEDG